MEKSITESCAEMITAQVQQHHMSTDELIKGLEETFRTLQEARLAALGMTPFSGGGATAIGRYDLDDLRRHPLDSIQPDGVICLESGKTYQLLSNRHLAQYDLTPRQYKKKWGIPLTTSLSSQALTRRRRQLAKKLGMGAGLAAWRAARMDQPNPGDIDVEPPTRRRSTEPG